MANSDEVATVSLKSRIPTFWRDKPLLWFAQFETVVNPQKPGEEAKFSLLVAHLEKTDVEQISDIVMSQTRTGRYEEAKKRLLSVYEESETKQLEKLLTEMELGDLKPSQLLRRMREPARDKMPDTTLQILWMRHLPASTRAVLSVNENPKLDVLAAMADKMHEQTREVHSVCACNQPSSSTSRHESSHLQPEPDLREAIMQLTREIAALKRDRSRQRRPSFRSRSRSKSQGRTNYYQQPSSDICFYHARYGKEARNCKSPCKFMRQEN